MLRFHLENKRNGAICNHRIGKPELFSVLEGKIYSLLLFNMLLTPWMKVLCLPAFTQFFQIMSFRVAAHKVMKGVRGRKATINSREFVAVWFFLVVFTTKLLTCPRSASAPRKRLVNGSISVNRSHKYVALSQFRFTRRAVKHHSLLSLWSSFIHLGAPAPDERRLPRRPVKFKTNCNDFPSFMWTSRPCKLEVLCRPCPMNPLVGAQWVIGITLSRHLRLDPAVLFTWRNRSLGCCLDN